jgi:hypothetical protein
VALIPKAKRKRAPSKALLTRHNYPAVRETLDVHEVRIDFLEAQMKAQLPRCNALVAPMTAMQRPAPIDDEITRMAFGNRDRK